MNPAQYMQRAQGMEGFPDFLKSYAGYVMDNAEAVSQAFGLPAPDNALLFSIAKNKLQQSQAMPNSPQPSYDTAAYVPPAPPSSKSNVVVIGLWVLVAVVLLRH